MSQVVSQEEMESILSSVPIKESEPEPVERKQPVHGYDFNQKDRLSKETKKRLEHIHNTFAKEIGVYISRKLRIDAFVKLVSIDQFSMSEVSESVSNPTCLFIFRLLEQERSAVFELNPDLVFFILDKVLGGPGKLANLERELTKIEQTIIYQLIGEFLNILKGAWKNHAKIETEISNYYSNINYLHFVESGESVISLTFEVEMGELNQLISLMYPYFLIEKLIPTLETQGNELKIKTSQQ